jgi:peptidoglycan/LPS O-acetylase OafA/YrhL
MNIKKLVVEFVTVFALVLVITAIVTFLWNGISHGANTIDWETSFRFAIIFGIILTWVKSRETPRKIDVRPLAKAS